MRLNDVQVACLLAAGANRKLIHRSWILDALTMVSSYTHEIESEKTATPGHWLDLEHLKYVELGVGDVVRINRKAIGIVESIENDLIHIGICSDGTKPCFDMLDVFDAKPQLTGKYFGSHPFTRKAWGDTSVGRYLWNIVALQYPFECEVFEFDNSTWKPDGILGKVKDSLIDKKCTTEQFEKFFDYSYFIGHLTELSNPSMTVKSLQTNPKVPEIKRKFVEAHQGQMHDPLVIQQLENELIKADKEYLGDDESTVFFEGLGAGKVYGVSRKKLFLTVGGIPAFDDSATDMDFIYNSLMEGWTPEALPSIANEIRKGSYDRGVETAKGGAETKLLMRAFQDTTICEDDCGTKRTITVDCSRFSAKRFLGRTIRVGNKDIVLTKENLDEYATGKVINLYSPLTCETKFNFCYKCCGQYAREFNAKLLGIQTVKISTKFMMLSMKNMHGTVLKVGDHALEDILL